MKMLWKSMIQRCHNPRNPSYRLYGARGITVCDRWRSSYEAFVSDVGPRPAGTCLDRIDNAKGYEPGNVRWATMREQHQNRRDSTQLTYQEVTRSVTEWARAVGLHPSTLWARLRRQWPLERALKATPDQRFRPGYANRVTEGSVKGKKGYAGAS